MRTTSVQQLPHLNFLKNSNVIFLLVPVIIFGVWFFSGAFSDSSQRFMTFKDNIIQYSGILSICLMSLSMLLATRPRWTGQWLTGLDKLYQLHKLVGIAAVIGIFFHWLLSQELTWFNSLTGLAATNPQILEAEHLTRFHQWLNTQRTLAVTIGQLALTLTLLLTAIALFKRVSYRHFKISHKWLAVIYLVLVFHTVVLTQTNYWTQPIGWVLGLFLLSGAMSSFCILLGLVGLKRKMQGVITNLTTYPDQGIIEGEIALSRNALDFEPGQLAFVTSKKGRTTHPFTIASSSASENNTLRFIAHATGDHTGKLEHTLRVKMPVTVEGPYGDFDFNDDKRNQLWIAYGDGITPFIAKMKQMTEDLNQRLVSKAEHRKQIELIFIDDKNNEKLIKKLTAEAQAAKVQFHIHALKTDGQLTTESLRKKIHTWSKSSIWYCGPNHYGKTLRKEFEAAGIQKQDIHQMIPEIR